MLIESNSNSTSRYSRRLSVLRQSIVDADSYLSLVLLRRQHIALELFVLRHRRIFQQLASYSVQHSAVSTSDFIARRLKHLRLLRYIVHDSSI